MAPGLGTYRIVQEVARGGMGAVFKALDPTGREVALKLLLAGRASSPQQRRRFRTEVRALQRARHPNVVEVLDEGEHEGAPWLALEWVEGESLDERLRRDGPLEPRHAAELVRTLALALHHCHSRGVLHRDLKPANVLLRAVAQGRSGQPEPLLSDFGLARELLPDGASPGSSTREGTMLGSPGWWPPEQARGDLRAVGPRSDVYGLGALLYAALTGRPPQQGATLAEVCDSALRLPAPPSSFRPAVPRALDLICLRCLEPDPDRRTPDAAALALALGGFLSGPPRLPRAALVLGLVAGAATLVVVGMELSSSAPAPPPGPPPSAPPPPPPPPAPPAERPAGPDPAELQRHLEEAEAAQRRGDARAVIEAAERALGLAPRHAPALLLRGEARLVLGDDEGVRDLDQALVIDPRLWRARALRAEVRSNILGDMEGCIADATRCLEEDPSMTMMHAVRGQARMAIGEYALAEADFEAILARLPDDGVALTGRAEARYFQDDLAGALRDAERAVALDPGAPAKLVVRGRTRCELGQKETGLADLRRARESIDSPELRAQVEWMIGQAEAGLPLRR